MGRTGAFSIEDEDTMLLNEYFMTQSKSMVRPKLTMYILRKTYEAYQEASLVRQGFYTASSGQGQAIKIQKQFLNKLPPATNLPITAQLQPFGASRG